MQASGPSRANVLNGTIAGRFKILKLLGVGGMGQVYQAEDTKLKRIVAIKRMAPRLQETESDRRRFLREAQQASALNHPNVAGVYDVLEDQGEVFLIMEFVEGTPLRAAMQAGKGLATDEFFRIATQGLEGLNAAHEKGILHGDIKPENIMLTPEGRVKVLDFGVARRFSLGNDDATLTSATIGGIGGGTPAYMAPEVLTQRPYDGRADLFSMGLVCYEMLGGQQPFETASLAETVASVLHKDPPPIAELNAKVPTSVSRVIQTMLAKDPSQRYSTARDVLVDLKRIEQGREPVFAAGHGLRPAKHGLQPSILVTSAVLLCAAAVALLFGFHSHKSHGPGQPTAATATSSITLAVVPFAPVQGDPKLTALGSGLVESVSAKLGRLTTDRAFEVLSAHDLHDKNLATFADARSQLGANRGLIVTLQTAGKLLEVNYSLLNENGTVEAGDSLSAPADDPFGVEDAIAQGAVRALRLNLRPEEQVELTVHGTDQPQAYKYYLQARGYLSDFTKAENIENAITMIAEALKLDPNFGRAKAALGEAYWRKYWLTKQNRWPTLAKQECDTAVTLGNSGAAGHICLGLVNDGTGHYAEAVAEFQNAVALDPTDENAYLGLALAYEHKGAINEAEDAYQQNIRAHRSSSVAYNLLGTFYHRRNEYDQAIAMFQKVTQLAPEGYGAYVNLGATYTDMGRYQEAIEPLRKSIAIRPFYGAYVNMGTAYFGMKNFSEAAAAYEQANKLNSSQYITWGDLGDARKYLGDKAGAQAAYLRAIDLAREELKVNPRDPDVLSSLGNYYSQLGDRRNALLYLNEALKYGSNDKDILLDAATVYNNLGDTGLAVEWIGKSVQAGYSASRIKDLPEFRNLENNPGYMQLVLRSESK